MKIVWHSNAGFSSTGYGNQTDLFVKRLTQAGHDVVVSAFYGLNGSPQNDNDVLIMPGSGKDAYGNDTLLAHKEYFNADIVLGLLDIFVINPAVMGALGCYYNWTPIDHDPVPPAVLRGAMAARGVIAMSRFGEKKLKEAGVQNVMYVPHGVDTQEFKPVDRAEARRKLNIDPNVFMALMVLANKGTPSRKAFDQQIRAFAEFHRKHPKSLLFLHTDLDGFQGEDLRSIIRLAGLPDSAWRVSPQYQLVMGMFGSGYLRDLYNAADVTMNATRGEGFGIPIIEAQACGCPVIVTDFSAMSELCGAGWRARISDKTWTQQNSYQVIPSVDDLTSLLKIAYQKQGDEKLRNKARDFAMKYDADTVMTQYWIPVLQQIEDQINPKVSLAPKKGSTTPSEYYPTGLYSTDGWLVLPSKDKTSDKALAISPSGEEKVVSGWGMEIDGVPLDIDDDPDGGVAKIVCREVTANYQLHLMDFKPGDVVLDIGAQCGVVSCYLAKRHPQITVYAFEPVTENFTRLQRNIKANGLDNVVAINKAVTGDGKRVVIYGDLSSNAGGSSIYGAVSQKHYLAESITLKDIFSLYAIDRVRLLKLDCEGSEYDILSNACNMLKRVDSIRGELHINNILREQGYNPETLIQNVTALVPDTKLDTLKIPDVTFPTPDLSVIIPTYNGENTITRAIDAALKQSANVEVVICDDGSTDSTPVILAEYARLFPHQIKVVTHEINRGQVTAMNTATQNATGNYFIFHGDDDYLGDASHLVKAMDNAPAHAGFAYGAMQYHGGRTDLVPPAPFRREDYNHYFACLSGVIWRRSLYTGGIVWREMHDIPGVGHGEDFDYALQVLEAGYIGIPVQGPTVLHYTLSFSRGWSKLQENKDVILEAFRAKHPTFAATHL